MLGFILELSLEADQDCESDSGWSIELGKNMTLEELSVVGHQAFTIGISFQIQNIEARSHSNLMDLSLLFYSTGSENL